MHPVIVQAVMTQRIRDLHRQASRARLARLLAENRRAQRRALALRASTDRHLPEPDQPPAHYPEFLYRTSGPLLREPAAAARARGQQVG